MRRVLITGATGNVGSAVIRELNKSKQEYKIIAGVRNQNSLKRVNLNFSIRAKYFDFTNFSSYDSALNNIDSLFLLRPPQITDVHKYFAPLIKTAEAKGIKQIIFLSVQGVEKSRLIPHNKIEKLILRSNLNFIFVRPGYFMQNLTTMFLDQIQQFRKLVIPAR